MNNPHQKPRITPKQIRIIKMAQRETGMDDTAYRALLKDEFGVTSSTKLSIHEANRLIDVLQKKGFTLKPNNPDWRNVSAPKQQRKTKSGKNVVALASPAEKAKVAAVASLIDWKVEDGLALFLAKRAKIKNGIVRTSRDAYLAIEALKKMFESGMKKQYGEDWWLMTFEDAGVMEYIKRHTPVEFS